MILILIKLNNAICYYGMISTVRYLALYFTILPLQHTTHAGFRNSHKILPALRATTRATGDYLDSAPHFFCFPASDL